MIAQTAQQFMEQEILPQCEQLEDQDLDLTVELLRKAAAELDLLAIDVPEKYEGLGLDKPSSTIVAEKLSRVGSSTMARRGRAPACGSAPAGVLMQYAEEPKGHPLGGSRNAVSVDDRGTAVDNLCIIPAKSS